MLKEKELLKKIDLLLEKVEKLEKTKPTETHIHYHYNYPYYNYIPYYPYWECNTSIQTGSYTPPSYTVSTDCNSSTGTTTYKYSL